MPDQTLSDTEALVLWREAERRLRLVDVEPPLSMTTVDSLLDILGPRRSNESLGDWLQRGHAPATTIERPSAEIIPFNPRRQRFTPVAEIVRLAADTSGPGIPLPTRELETADGRFRLRVTLEGDQVVLTVQALGLASDEFAGRTIGLAAVDAEEPPVALLQLDEDGDGTVRLPDTTALRQALLKPILGLVEDN
jgi:hypothetical protein